MELPVIPAHKEPLALTVPLDHKGLRGLKAVKVFKV